MNLIPALPTLVGCIWKLKIEIDFLFFFESDSRMV